MEALNEGDRLMLLIDELCCGSQVNFAKATGINITSLNKIVTGSGEQLGLHLTQRYINKICQAFPNVNQQFLLDGVSYPGDISVHYVKARYEVLLADKDKEISFLRDTIQTQNLTIKGLLEK